MKLFVGLGNPGKEYENTRHNAGFKFIDFLASKFDLSFNNKFSSLFAEKQILGEKYIFLKPQTYMNDSGKAVSEVMNFYKLEADDVYIAFDDLDIKEGEYKVQKSKYPKVHNGINDIILKTGDDKFTFIRIGVDGRSEVERGFLAGKDYVLQKGDLNFSEVFNKIELELPFGTKFVI